MLNHTKAPSPTLLHILSTRTAQRVLRLLIALFGGVFLGMFVVARGAKFHIAIIALILSTLIGLFLLTHEIPGKDLPIKKAILYLTVITGVTGSAFVAVDIGPLSLFPYRILLVILWMLFGIGVLLNEGRLNIYHIKVRHYLLFLMSWLCYAILSLAWADSKVDGIRHIVFLLMGTSLIFFVIYYFSNLKDLTRLYNLWLLVLPALIAIGFWETTTGHHLSVSKLALEQYPRARFMPTAVFHNPNDFATYLALTTPFLLAFIRYNGKTMRRLLGIIILSSSLYLLITTHSRANYLAVLAEVTFWFFFLLRVKGKIRAVALTGLAVLLLLVLFPGMTQNTLRTVNLQLNSLVTGMRLGERSLYVRVNLFRNSLIFLVEHLGFGVGAGNVEYHMANFGVYDTQGILNVHNWWVEILTNYGLFIFVGYVLFYSALLWGLFKLYGRVGNRREKMICEALLVALVGFSFASISASSIIALKPQWFLFAFALAFLNYSRNRGRMKQP